MRRPLFFLMPFLASVPVLAAPLVSNGQSSPRKTAPAKASVKVVPPQRKLVEKPLGEEEAIVHVLNRFAFGPRPGDVEKIRESGWRAWVERQLNPGQISDTLVDEKLASYTLARLPAHEYASRETAVRKGVAIANRRTVQQRARSESMQDSKMADRTGGGISLSDAERRDLESSQVARRELIEASRQFVTEKFVRAVESERQLQEVLVDFWSNHFNIDMSKTRSVKIADEHEVVRSRSMGKFVDLLKASAHSPAMLLYLDNFQSVADAPKLESGSLEPRQMPSNWEGLRRLARRGFTGAVQLTERIETLAQESNTSPDVLYERFIRSMGAGNRDRRGLNENYARELLELHTLGVEGGYTQKDVQEVARCLTGWTVSGGRYGGEFSFNSRLHDNGTKVVLGKSIPAGGGIRDGEMVLEMLANHPSTMRHVSRKLCVRFVSDNPPAALVERCVQTWRRTDGDIREVVRTIAFSPEFLSRASFRTKIKSPFEYAVSSVRALGGTVLERFGTGLGVRPTNNAGSPTSLEGQVNLMGQPLFRYAFPTGWPEDSSKWVSSGALISRINFALSLTSGQLRDVVLAGKATELGEGKTNAQWIDSLSRTILGNCVATSTRETVVRQLNLIPTAIADPAAMSPRLTALLLGSPEFQRR